MKKVKNVMIEIEEIEDVICNMCGDSCRPGKDVPDYYGLIEATFTTGYESTHFDDYLIYSFSLCEKCLYELVKSLKIKPECKSYY